MKKKFDYLSFIKNLISFSYRQLEGERKAADFIISFLNNQNIEYHLDYFWTKVPKIEKAILKVDKKEITCKGCSFVSGKIRDKDYLISSLIPSCFFLDKSNINFNPKCSSISLSNFYFAPALAVSRKDLDLILKSKEIEGEVKVRPVKYKARNILIGNFKKPRVISFAHYDSIEKGTIDNASGVTVMMGTILSQPDIIKDNLFVFSANEELSYDRPTYWGYGFRAFEKKFFKIMKLAKKLIIIDCVGNSSPKIYRDENLIYLAFPIKNREKWKYKIEILSGKDIQKLMTVYHSDLDGLSEIKQKYLTQTIKKFLSEINT